jgi:hypothetical protein
MYGTIAFADAVDSSSGNAIEKVIHPVLNRSAFTAHKRTPGAMVKSIG